MHPTPDHNAPTYRGWLKGRRGRSARPPADRIKDRVAVDLETGCHVWTGPLSSRGYGRIKLTDRRFVMAHRVAYEAAKSPIPDGLEIDHLCRNRACCNPDHLEPVTHAENVKRGLSGARGRAMTHCQRGHEYTPENTLSAGGGRSCRTCNRLRAQRRRDDAKRVSPP